MRWSLIKLPILNGCYSGHIAVPATDLDELFVGLADDAALASGIPVGHLAAVDEGHRLETALRMVANGSNSTKFSSALRASR